MEYGVCLPFGSGSSIEAVDAAAETAERLGWRDVWVTDHLLVDRADAADYGRITEAITTLAYLAGRTTRVRLGASVIVVPPRNAVILAKELATVDVASRGRLIAGVGVGWSEREFANLGMTERHRVRGAYTEEAVTLWRHLWSGSEEAFRGRFHAFENYAFGPLPPQGAALPIWFGGRDRRALERVGRQADAYHSSATPPAEYADRIPLIRAAAENAGRPMPRLSARVRVRLDEAESAGDGFYAMRGSGEDVAREIGAFAALGVDHLALSFREVDPEGVARAMERFVAEVRPLA